VTTPFELHREKEFLSQRRKDRKEERDGQGYRDRFDLLRNAYDMIKIRFGSEHKVLERYATK